MPRKLTNTERDRLERLLQDNRRLYAVTMFSNDDISVVVQGHAYIETYLERLLERNMPQPGIVQWYKMDITRRLEIARSLGEIKTPLASAIQSLTEIRNGLAHNPGFTVLESDVAKLDQAMEHVVPTAMAAICNPSSQDYRLFLQMVGVHGILLRNMILFLNLLLQAQLERKDIRLLDALQVASEIFRQPFHGSRKKFSEIFQFDAEGKRYKNDKP